MKLSDRTYIIILMVMIVGLVLVTYWRFQKPRESLPLDFPGLDLQIPEIDFSQLDQSNFEKSTTTFDWGTGFSPEKRGEQKWISPDGNLQLICPENWTIMEKVFLEYGLPTGAMLSEEEVLLFAYSFKVAGHGFPTLTVGQISTEKNIEELTMEIGKNIEMSGGKKEIIRLETKDGVTDLELVFEYPGQISFYSKGKIIFTEEKTYLIFFTTSQQVWSQFEGIAKKVFDSIQLL